MPKREARAGRRNSYIGNPSRKETINKGLWWAQQKQFGQSRFRLLFSVAALVLIRVEPNRKDRIIFLFILKVLNFEQQFNNHLFHVFFSSFGRFSHGSAREKENARYNARQTHQNSSASTSPGSRSSKGIRNINRKINQFTFHYFLYKHWNLLDQYLKLKTKILVIWLTLWSIFQSKIESHLYRL